MKLRISKMAGFGRGRALEFEKTCVTLGTAPASDVRFDPTWDKGVAASHAFFEQTGDGWTLHDGGSAAGTFLGGTRVVRPERILAAVEIELGKGGPRVHVEPLFVEARQTAAPALAPVPSAPPSPPAAPSPAFSPILKTALPSIAALLVLGGVIWALRPGPRTVETEAPAAQPALPPLMDRNARKPANAPESKQETAEATPAPSPETQERPPLTLSPEERQLVEQMISLPTYAGLRHVWQKGEARSPYVRALLAQETHWFAQMIPFLPRREGNRERPGLFVGECFGPGFALDGTPQAPEEVIAAIAPAMSRDGAGTARIASASYTAAKNPRLSTQSRERLKSRLTEFATPGAAPSSTARAVLIGINEFESISGLWSCRNDAAAIAKVLTTQGIFEPGNIRLMTDTKSGRDYPTRENVIAALKETVAASGPNDIILIAFSTHGLYDETRNDSAFCTVDASLETKVLGLYGQELQAILATGKARNILILVDACHAGGAGAIGGTQGKFGALGEKKSPPPRAPIPEKFYEMLGASRGHVVIRACRADQTTPDLPILGQSYLTLVFLAGLTGEADTNKDGIVTLSELRIYITTAIPEASRHSASLGADQSDNGGPLEPTFTSSSFGEAGDLPLTVIP